MDDFVFRLSGFIVNDDFAENLTVDEASYERRSDSQTVPLLNEQRKDISREIAAQIGEGIPGGPDRLVFVEVDIEFRRGSITFVALIKIIIEVISAISNTVQFSQYLSALVKFVSERVLSRRAKANGQVARTTVRTIASPVPSNPIWQA